MYKTHLTRTLLLSLTSIALIYTISQIPNFIHTARATVSEWIGTTDTISYTAGNVGIGTTKLQQQLHVVDGEVDPVFVKEFYNGDGQFTDMSAYVMVHDGDILYAGGGSTVSIIDVSDKANPTLITTIQDNTGDFQKLYGIHDLEIKDNLLFALSYHEQSMTIIDVSDPSDPEFVSVITKGVGGYGYMTYPSDMAIYGNYVYIISNSDKYKTIVDISNPSSPSNVYNLPTPYGDSAPNQIVAYNGYLYVGGYQGVRKYSLANPIYPNSIGSIGGTGYARLGVVYDLYAIDNMLFITSWDQDSLYIVDITNPSSHIKLTEIYDGDGTFDKLDHLRGVTAYRNMVAVAAKDEDTVTFIDITDPTDPKLIDEIMDDTDSYNKLGQPLTVTNDDEYVYISSQEGGVTIVGNVIEKDSFVVGQSGVGVGTLNPQATLDIDGYMRLKINSGAPASCTGSNDGALALSSTYRTCVCKSGTGWVYTSDGSTSCSW